MQVVRCCRWSMVMCCRWSGVAGGQVLQVVRCGRWSNITDSLLSVVEELSRVLQVNNAGVLEMGSIENTSLEQYDRSVTVWICIEINATSINTTTITTTVS